MFWFVFIGLSVIGMGLDAEAIQDGFEHNGVGTVWWAHPLFVIATAAIAAGVLTYAMKHYDGR